MGAHSSSGTRRQLRSSLARRALPIGRGRLGTHLPAPGLVRRRRTAPRRVIPTNAAPITFYIRETADWLPHALAQQSVEEPKLAAASSPEALQLRALLQQRGACFANDIQRIANLTRRRPSTRYGSSPPPALPQPTASTSSAPDGPSAQIDHHRNSRQTPHPQLRWPLVAPHEELHAAPTAIEQARRTDAALESFARQLLARYGVLFRDLLTRESNAPKWRELLNILRRLEARGEIRGGRFVTGFGGEQFALPEAMESLRAARSRECNAVIAVSAADPLNLAGTVVPGERVPSVPGKQVLIATGVSISMEKQTRSAPAKEAPPSPCHPLCSHHLHPLRFTSSRYMALKPSRREKIFPAFSARKTRVKPRKQLTLLFFSDIRVAFKLPAITYNRK